MVDKRVFSLRGAVCCLNDREDIKKQTIAMYDELLSKNNLNEEDIVSVVFSVTKDLDAENPASALRSEGRAGETALFVNQEAHFQKSLERVIRLLIHCYLDSSRKPVFVYRNGAEVLRPELGR
jgi:chorismate mutase